MSIMNIISEYLNKNMMSNICDKNILPMGVEEYVEDEWFAQYDEPVVEQRGNISDFRKMIQNLHREREGAMWENVYDQYRVSCNVASSWEDVEEELEDEMPIYSHPSSGYWGDYSYDKVMALIDLHPRKEVKKLVAPKPVVMLSERTTDIALSRKFARAEENTKNAHKNMVLEIKKMNGIPTYIPTEHNWNEIQTPFCPICEDELTVDKSVATPCCQTKMCNPCARNSILKTNKCPTCNKGMNVESLKKQDEITVPIVPTHIKKESLCKIEKDMVSNIVFVNKSHKQSKKSSPIKKTETPKLDLVILSEDEKQQIKNLLVKKSEKEMEEEEMKKKEMEEKIQAGEVVDEEEEDVDVSYSKILSAEEKEFASAFASRQAAQQKKREQEKREMSVEKQEQKLLQKEQKWQKIQKDSLGKMRWTFDDYSQIEKSKRQAISEIPKEEITEERKSGYDKLANISEHADKLRKSAFCKSVFHNNFTCTFGSTCKFAHTISEWTPSVCFFGTSCKFINDKSKPCSHIHPHESKEEVMKRCNISVPSADITIPVLPLPKNFTFVKKSEKVSEKKENVENKQVWFVVKVAKVDLVQIQETCSEHHEDETHHEHKEYEARCKAFAQLSNMEEMHKIKSNNKGSKLCSLFLEKGKCYRKVCNFAHNITEYNPISCAFGDSCKMMKTCPHQHPTETKDECASRLGLKLATPVATPKKVTTPVKTWTPVQPKIEEIKVIEDVKQIEEDGFMTVQSKKVKKESPSKNVHSVCKWVQQYGKCKYEHKDCDFAHNINQYNPQPCSHFRNCRFMNRCKSIHQGETKQDVLYRLNINL